MAENERNDVKLAGSLRAALIISFLPEETSRMVLEHLDVIEREYITRELIELPYFEPEVVESIMREYM